MENTIKNMELVLTKMGIELESDGINQAKTLSNTYSSLLKQYMDGISFNSLLPISQAESLNWQRVIALQHFDKVNQLINKKLEETSYVDANNLSVVSDKLARSASNLKDLIGRDARVNNLPQNKISENKKIKQVAIFGLHFASAKEKYEEIKSGIHLSVMRKEENYNGGEITLTTNDLKITARGYSDNYRGVRLDEIYVDKNLKISDLHIIQSMKREKDTPVYYF